MTARLRRWRVRRRLLVSGTALVLCSVTIVLTVVSLGSYVRYQQLSADARTASVNLDKIERYFGQPDPSTQISPLCDPLCFILGWDVESGKKAFELVALSSSTAVIIMPDGTVVTIIHTEPNRLRFVSASGLEVIANFVYGFDNSGTWFIGAAIGSPEVIGPLERIDFLDEAGQTVFSVSAKGPPTAIIDAPVAARDAAQAAEDAMMNLVAVGGGALLAFLAMSVLGWMATRRRVASRRAPQRRGAADSVIRQQSSGGQAWMDRVTMGLIASALRALDHPDDQDRYREEWAADYDEIQGKKQRLRWALLLRLFAPVGIRSARRDALAMSPPQQQ